MNIEEQRKAFNAYFKDKYPELHKDVFNEDGDDRAIIGYSFALSAWLASTNREGYKLAPVEPNDHMRCVVRDFGPDIEDYEKMSKHKWESLCSDIYKAMIGACDDH